MQKRKGRGEKEKEKGKEEEKRAHFFNTNKIEEKKRMQFAIV